ncbi:unnamed protein product [Didymodactylos carnosus]|uniref:Carbohydrate kinase PfkB domain-containing protein n=1 Tax=Didymodactylos carnosus TaxID=1234261 RepID=A0A813YF62_9BILA|nr:unnamed protein product [Didymodactylos carnosus]CAF1065001.1 unnamed protein product [Didymodactylos carnosus]CAF3669176.1 unnamed protein product [Didymodactylos carnosus]CAF3830138.1 unnamed protein product [Didymodactylos carnosus]
MIVQRVPNVRYYTSLPYSKKLFCASEEVRRGLEEKKAIVALETAILTHGLPKPINIETQFEIEQIVRKNGCIPATIALIDGQIKIGLTHEEIERLGSTDKQTFKASRRDLPYLLSQKLTAGTTVSSTMLIAHRLGIPIFATGGIGGVHRDVTDTFDISADLDEFGRTPVCVVSSGVKSILDIPRTLEYLETKGVGVYTYDTTDEFPNFFTKSSGYRSCGSVKTIEDAAQLVFNMLELNLQSGLLLAVPIDEEHELQGQMINNVIEEALDLAKKQNIRGNKVTPYILQEVRRLTDGQSIPTNQKLIYKNAKVAAQIAAALSKLQYQQHPCMTSKTDKNEKSQLLVIGGINIDMHIKLCEKFKIDSGSTLKSQINYDIGGVAYNITNALGLFNVPVQFLSVSGTDNLLSSTLLTSRQQLIIKAIENQLTATYVSLLDEKSNELLCGFGSMDIYEHSLTPQFIEENIDYIRNNNSIMFDANLSEATMDCIVRKAIEYQKSLVFISAGGPKKAMKIRNFIQHLNMLFCNRLELEAIINNDDNCKDNISLALHMRTLMKSNKNMKFICVTLGADGVMISVRNDNDDSNENFWIKRYQLKSNLNNKIVNVTGAGDSLCAGILSQILTNKKNESAIICGLLAAKATIQDKKTISNKLSLITDQMINDTYKNDVSIEQY